MFDGPHLPTIASTPDFASGLTHASRVKSPVRSRESSSFAPMYCRTPSKVKQRPYFPFSFGEAMHRMPWLAKEDWSEAMRVVR